MDPDVVTQRLNSKEACAKYIYVLLGCLPSASAKAEMDS